MNTAVAEDFCQEKKAPLPPVAATFREGHRMEDEVGWDCVQTALCRQGLRGAEKPTHPMYLCHLPETVPEIPLLAAPFIPTPSWLLSQGSLLTLPLRLILFLVWEYLRSLSGE